MYTFDDSQLKLLKANSQIIDNAMSMCLLTAGHGWRSRTPSNKMEAMLTSGGGGGGGGGSSSGGLDHYCHWMDSGPNVFRSTSMEDKKQQSGEWYMLRRNFTLERLLLMK